MTKQQGDLGLYGYQGYVRQYPLVAFLFLLAVLGLIGFPISPTFIGEDLLFSHIHEDQFVLAFLAALAFVMEGVAAIRIYARLFLGTVPESTIDSHSTSLPKANTKNSA
jgi:NADH:ubiquinone oxidoreductase subunit 4 (subunit M)